ncbi:hypothetical protein LX15_004047 [Streptoalloteichus tenebrarius]|uniref:Uncharacterized protein n=1 Tax=Streptoalloteichus tenebrarius (strain ATCC 17920 / DSM 40477 / JCM 4838 / CBS 697.72 / NBRC 16177 / NCIMB 11028 / NRRL B-12390 / A12253. 1 / ISP 5477) TaxID=1933 RepID=A0ABT1HXT8_STRSD|nr:permease [Streptoalloteichus tenebrarius]MCP2260334.1 hypothetical protein [Streptoalloteichus tenebrarius]BFF03085.1 hypothetical protein GCM10020241_47600 [Streptoalloteichus tenebrarius]
MPSELDELRTEMNDLKARVANLEEKIEVARADAAAARVLAGAADRDVAEFRDVQRDHTRLLHAMRADLTDLKDEVHTGFAEVRGKLDATAAGQETIIRLISRALDREADGNS